MAGRGLGHLRLALVGQDRQGVTAVGWIRGAAHPAALLQPGDDLGQARQRALGHVASELIRRVRSGASDSRADLVLEVADAGVAVQLRIERRRQPVQRAGQGEPGLPLLGVKPAGSCGASMRTG